MTHRPLIPILAALLLTVVPRGAAAQETFTACFVPEVGALYLISATGANGLPTQCLSTNHVEISWTDGQTGVTDHGALTGLADDDHPEYVREGEAAGGDLAGAYPLPRVVALQGFGVADLAPADGQVLAWDAAQSVWLPSPERSGVTDHGLLSGLSDDDHPEYVRENQVAAGDLQGLFGAPTVAAIRGNSVVEGTPNEDDVLMWDSSLSAWVPTAGAGVADHGALAGLGDDDHTQYLLTNGNRTTTDGFAVTGMYGVGGIAAEGSGERLLWYPAKGAIRAGSSSSWTAANIGGYSAAFGAGTSASGANSFAAGSYTSASGGGSVAVGSNTVASGSGAVAAGTGTTASGNAAVAMGSTNTASGNYTTVFGNNATAQAQMSLVIGQYNVVEGSPTSWVGTDPLFVAGNGVTATPSNALTLYKNGNLTIAGTLTENSDRRLKVGIETLGPILDRLQGITPVRFRFRDGTGHPTDPQIGLIAQEVAEAFPELVTVDSQGYLSLAYPKLTAVLLGALQEMEARYRTLEARTREMEARLLRLEAALDSGVGSQEPEG